LVVDDLRDMRDLIAATLKAEGYRVVVAANGKSALEKVQTLRPDLVITDWMMPLVSGPDLIAQLKKNSAYSHIPVILLTAKSDDESKVIGTQIGADAFLGKPFNQVEILSVVRNLLSLKSREREVEALNHQLTENVLKRYLPPELVEDIIRGEFEFSVEPTERLVTILFSDLCGFTQLGEKLRTAHYAAQLNDYLTVMNEIIFEHSGTVDKFMGDAIMVLFGTPSEMSPREQAERASTCALAMQAELETLNAKWQTQGLPALKARIGLHQGKAVVGNFGSARRSDYTCIGRSVNLASRIEGVCTPGSVFVSEAIREQLPRDTREVGSFELKGIDGKTRLYELS
jgi:class 3 adenylate cyclase